MEQISYVYVLLDPRNPGPFKYGNYKFSHEPIYVGKGSKYRMYDHDENCKHNPLKANIIAKIKRSGFSDVIRIKKKENLTKASALNLEIKLIALIGRRDLKLGPLTNLTDGGEGGTNPGPRTRKILGIKSSEAYARKTEQEKDAIRKKRSETLLNKTSEEKISANKKRADTMSNKTDKEKTKRSKRISKKVKLSHKNATIESKETRYKNISDTAKKRTPEQRAEIGKKISLALTDISVEEKEIRRKRNSKAQIKANKTKSKEDILAARKRAGETNKNRTQEQKESSELKRRTTLSKRTEEQKKSSLEQAYKSRVANGSNRSLSTKDVKKIRHLYSKGFSCLKLGKQFGKDPSTIYSIVVGKTYKETFIEK